MKIKNEKQITEMEIEMFGESIADIKAAASQLHGRLENPYHLIQYALGILSDSQEVVEHNPKLANQLINKSKFFMSEATILLRTAR